MSAVIEEVQEDKKVKAIAKKNKSSHNALAAEPEEEERHLSDDDQAVQKQIERVLQEDRARDAEGVRGGGVMDPEQQAQARMRVELEEELKDQVDEGLLQDLDQLGRKLWQMQLASAETGNRPDPSKELVGSNAAGAPDEAVASNFDIKDAVTQILAQEKEYLQLRESLDVSYITYRTEQVIDELNMLEKSRQEKLKRDQEAPMLLDADGNEIQPFRVKAEYSAVLDSINRQLCRATMFEARKKLAEEQARALLRKDQFSAAMKLIERQHEHNSICKRAENENESVKTGGGAEAEEAAKAISEQSKPLSAPSSVPSLSKLTETAMTKYTLDSNEELKQYFRTYVKAQTKKRTKSQAADLLCPTEVLAKHDRCPLMVPDVPAEEDGDGRKRHGKAAKAGKSKHHRTKAKSPAAAGKPAADKKAPVKPAANAAQEEIMMTDNYQMNESEASSDLSHKYKVPRSRQALCRPLFYKCLRNAFAFQTAAIEEERELKAELYEPMANHYVEKVIRRLARLVNGEELGGMVDSELEDLEVDDDFELQRRKMEVPSSYNDPSEYLSERSILSKSTNAKFHLNFGSSPMPGANEVQPQTGGRLISIQQLHEQSSHKSLAQASCDRGATLQPSLAPSQAALDSAAKPKMVRTSLNLTSQIGVQSLIQSARPEPEKGSLQEQPQILEFEIVPAPAKQAPLDIITPVFVQVKEQELELELNHQKIYSSEPDQLLMQICQEHQRDDDEEKSAVIPQLPLAQEEARRAKTFIAPTVAVVNSAPISLTPPIINSDGQTEPCKGSAISKEKANEKSESVSERKSAAKVLEKESEVADSQPSSVELMSVAMPVFMSDYAPAEQRSSIDVTINTVEKQTSARIRQDSEIVVEMTEHSQLSSICQLQEVSLQSLTLNQEEQKEEPGMCEEVVPEVDVAYTDIGIAVNNNTIRSQESAKDNEAVSRRSDLPMESEVSKKNKSGEHKSSRQLEEEIYGPDMAALEQLDAAEAQALEQVLRRSISTDLHIAEDNEPSEEQFHDPPGASAEEEGSAPHPNQMSFSQPQTIQPEGPEGAKLDPSIQEQPEADVDGEIRQEQLIMAISRSEERKSMSPRAQRSDSGGRWPQHLNQDLVTSGVGQDTFNELTNANKQVEVMETEEQSLPDGDPNAELEQYQLTPESQILDRVEEYQQNLDEENDIYVSMAASNEDAAPVEEQTTPLAEQIQATHDEYLRALAQSQEQHFDPSLLVENGKKVKKQGQRESLIDVDKSFNLISDIKKRFSLPSKAKLWVGELSRDSNQQQKISVGSMNAAGHPQPLLDLKIRQQQQNDQQEDVVAQQSPTRILNEHIPKFENSPETQDQQIYVSLNFRQHQENKKQKWKEVVKFMKSNPLIMMELMPPTPRRKLANEKSKAPAAEESAQQAYLGEANRYLDSSFKWSGEAQQHQRQRAQNNNTKKSQSPLRRVEEGSTLSRVNSAYQTANPRKGRAGPSSQTQLSGASTTTRPATSKNISRTMLNNTQATTNHLNISNTNIGSESRPTKLPRPSTTAAQMSGGSQQLGAGRTSKPLGQRSQLKLQTRGFSAYAAGSRTKAGNQAAGTFMSRRNSTAALSQALAPDLAMKDNALARHFKNYLKLKKFQKSRSNLQKVDFTKTQSAYSNTFYEKSGTQRHRKGLAAGRPPLNQINSNIDLDDYIQNQGKLKNLYRNQFKEIKEFRPMKQNNQNQSENQIDGDGIIQMADDQDFDFSQFNKEGTQIYKQMDSDGNVEEEQDVGQEIGDEMVMQQVGADMAQAADYGYAGPNLLGAHILQHTPDSQGMHELAAAVARGRAQGSQSQSYLMEAAGNPKMVSQEAYTQSNIFNGSAGWPDARATQVDHSSMKIMSALNTDEHALQNIQELRESQSGHTSGHQGSAADNNRHSIANLQSQASSNALGGGQLQQSPTGSQHLYKTFQQKDTENWLRSAKSRQNTNIQQWPRIALNDSHQLLYGALRDIQDTNQEVVKKIKNNQRAYDITSKGSQILSLRHRIEQLQHIEAPLEKAQVQKLRPAAVSFADYTSGLRESVQRLNPSKNYRTNSREQQFNIQEPRSRVVMKASPIRKGVQKQRGQSSTKHKAMNTHEKRLEKLHKLRSKLKDHSKEHAQKHCKDEHVTHGLSLKKRKSKVSCQEYKIITADKSCLDLNLNQPDLRSIEERNQKSEREDQHAGHKHHDRHCRHCHGQAQPGSRGPSSEKRGSGQSTQRFQKQHLTSLGSKILKRRYRSTSHEGHTTQHNHRRKKERAQLQSALQVSSCPLSPPGERPRSAGSSGGLKNGNGDTKVHFKSLDASKGKKRSKSRPGSPNKKSSKKSGGGGSAHHKRVKSPSYKRTSQVSDDSDCTEETRLVADGCPGCHAAEDQSSGAPVIQRIAVSRDQNQAQKILDEKTMRKQRAKQQRLHKLSVSIKKSHGRSNSSLDQNTITQHKRSLSGKKERRVGTQNSLKAKRNSKAGATSWLPGLSVSLVFDKDKDEIAVQTEINHPYQEKAKRETQRRLVQSKLHSICTHTEGTPDPSSERSEGEDYNYHNYEKQRETQALGEDSKGPGEAPNKYYYEAGIRRKRTLVLDEAEAKKGGYYRFEKSFEHEELISEVISQDAPRVPMAASPRSKVKVPACDVHDTPFFTAPGAARARKVYSSAKAPSNPIEQQQCDKPEIAIHFVGDHPIFNEIPGQQQARGQSNNKRPKNKYITPRATEKSKIGQYGLAKQRWLDAKKLKGPISESDYPSRDGQKVDWLKTNLFRACMEKERFKRPDLTDDMEKKIITYITNMRLNPQHHQRAHVLMPIFEDAFQHIKTLLCNQMNLPKIFSRIKRQYQQIDYPNTIKLLVRTRICAQIREDMTLLMCKYLDFMEELRNIQQLRDESASDFLLKVQIDKMQIHGTAFLKRASKFHSDYEKTFPEGRLWLGDRDMVVEVEGIMERFGVLQREYSDLEYKQLIIENEWIR